MELVFENNKMELNLELSFDEAVRKHKEMWGAMQSSLGDNPTLTERAAFKAGWVEARRAAGEKRVINNCYLCEYNEQFNSHSCVYCPYNWNDHIYYGCEKGIGTIDWRTSKISDILGLPLRKKYAEEEEE